MKKPTGARWRHILPWIVSAGLLAYVFGWATDWGRLIEAMRHANVPLFLLFATCDRLAFFVVWTLLQAAALRRFVTHVPLRSVVAVRGGSELLRAVSNPLSDAAFFLGLSRLAAGRIEAVLAAALVPGVCHFLVMLVQMTLALPFLPGGVAGNNDVGVTLAITWPLMLGVVLAAQLASRGVAIPGGIQVHQWMQRFPLRELWPFFAGFVGLAIFDVVIQRMASDAFGTRIGWVALTARIPLVYLSFLIPTLGNFGTRELSWAKLFEEFGTHDELIAYAFAVNCVFLILNVVIGVIFLRRALDLMAAVRRARSQGEPVPRPAFHDPTDT